MVGEEGACHLYGQTREGGCHIACNMKLITPGSHSIYFVLCCEVTLLAVFLYLCFLPVSVTEPHQVIISRKH